MLCNATDEKYNITPNMSSQRRHDRLFHALSSTFALGRAPTKLVSRLRWRAQPTHYPRLCLCLHVQSSFVVKHIAICVEVNLFVRKWFFAFFVQSFEGGGGCEKRDGRRTPFLSSKEKKGYLHSIVVKPSSLLKKKKTQPRMSRHTPFNSD